MADLNIPSYVVDPNHRYIMPCLLSKLESRGCGSKTAIQNMSDVARALQRDPVHLIKFFGYELGAVTLYTNKEGEGERAVVNGHHDASKLQALVDKFIEKFVLCSGCNLPEIDMVVKKGIVAAVCRACGWKGKLDNGHKLATYILKNPPNPASLNPSRSSRADRQQARLERQRKNLHSECDEENKEQKTASENCEVEGKKTKEKKDKKIGQGEGAEGDSNKDMKEKQGKETKEKGKKDKKDKKEKWEQKTHEKERAACAEESASEDDQSYSSKLVTQTVVDLVGFVQSQEVTVESMYEEVHHHQTTKDMDNRLRMFVVVSALFPEGSLDAAGIVARKEYIKAFTDMGRMSFIDWIWSFEAYLALHPEALKKFPLTLKALYDEDLAEEEAILEYYRCDRSSPIFLQ